MNEKPTLLWFRQDLRLSDNPALHAAIQRGSAVIAVYIWAPDEEGAWSPGGASRWWLHQSLRSLADTLKKKGIELMFRKGPTEGTLLELAEACGVGAVFWNRRYEPEIIRRDAALKDALRARGLEARSFNSALLFEPWELRTKTESPYKVFTPFWKACLQRPDPGSELP